MENESKTCPNSTSPKRRSTRMHESVDYSIPRGRNPSVTEEDEKAEHGDAEDTPIRSTRRRDKKNDIANEKEEDHDQWVRRSSRQTKLLPNVPEDEGCLSDGTHQSAENGVRRSKRAHHKPTFYDPVAYEKHQSSSDDDEDDEEEEENEEEEEEGKIYPKV